MARNGSTGCQPGPGRVDWQADQTPAPRETSASSLTPSGIAYDRDGPPEPYSRGAAPRRRRRPPDVGPPVGGADRGCGMPCASTCAASASRTGPPPAPSTRSATCSTRSTTSASPSCHLVASSLGAGVAVEVALPGRSLVRSLLLAPPGRQPAHRTDARVRRLRRGGERGDGARRPRRRRRGERRRPGSWGRGEPSRRRPGRHGIRAGDAAPGLRDRRRLGATSTSTRSSWTRRPSSATPR